MSRVNRVLAVIYALGLGIGEAIKNWGDWQYAPLWIVDYVVVIWLLYGALIKDQIASARVLLGAWCFALAMMYMAFAISTDPSLDIVAGTGKLVLIGLLMSVSLVGAFLSNRALVKHAPSS